MQRVANRSSVAGRRSLPDVAGLGGAVAGLLAGAVMVIISPLLSLINGISLWEPPRLIAATVYGSAVLNDLSFELGPVLVGLVIHFIISIALGFIFGIVLNRVLKLTTDFGLPVYVGLAYGLIAFFIAYYVVLPLINPPAIESYVGSLIAQNVVFGVFLGIFYMIVRPRPYTNTIEQL